MNLKKKKDILKALMMAAEYKKKIENGKKIIFTENDLIECIEDLALKLDDCRGKIRRIKNIVIEETREGE